MEIRSKLGNENIMQMRKTAFFARERSRLDFNLQWTDG